MNKYRGIAFPVPGIEASREPEPVDLTFDGGIVLAQDALRIELNQSPELDAVRIEREGLRTDYGRTLLGAVAGLRIIALGEHRFLDPDGALFEKIFRLFLKASTKVRIESWDGAAWNIEIDEDDTTGIGTAEVLLSWKSYFDSVFFADGNFVYRWDQSAFVEDEGNDFPAGNVVGGNEPALTSITITPAGADGDIYRVHYSLRIRSVSLQLGSATVSIHHKGVEIATRDRTIPASTDKDRDLLFEHEIIELNRSITDGDVLQLSISGISTSPDDSFGVSCIVASGTDQQQVVSDHNGTKAVDDLYTVELFFLDVSETGATATIRISVDFVGAAGVFVQIHEDVYAGFNDVFTGVKHTIPLDLTAQMGNNEIINSWKIEIIGEVSADFKFPTDPQPEQSTDINWTETTLVELHGFNLATDADESEGVTYSTLGVAINDFYIVQEDGPENLLMGRFLGVFGDRILVLRFQGDPQKIGWCASGLPSDWIGEGAGSTLRPSLSDPIDELMGFAVLSANVGALFRRRSIERVVITGRSEPAFAFYPWIQKLGTDSPFSIIEVPGGVMFFGSDKEVYYLTEAGHTSVGHPISEAFKNFTLDQLGGIEAVYDPVDQEYILSVDPTATEFIPEIEFPDVEEDFGGTGTAFVGSQDAECIERVGDELYHIFTIDSGNGSGIGWIQVSSSAPGGTREIDIGMVGGGGDGGDAPSASQGDPSGIWLDGSGNIMSPGASITSVLHALGGGAGGFSHNDGQGGGGGGGGGAKGRAGAYATKGGSQWGGRGRSSPGFFIDQPYASGGGGGTTTAGEPGVVSGNEAIGGKGGRPGIAGNGPIAGGGGNGTTGTDPVGAIGGGGGAGEAVKIEDLAIPSGTSIKVQAAGPVTGIGDGGNAGEKGRGGYVHVAEYIRTPLVNAATLSGGT